jgi:hypothetical protein
LRVVFFWQKQQRKLEEYFDQAEYCGAASALGEFWVFFFNSITVNSNCRYALCLAIVRVVLLFCIGLSLADFCDQSSQSNFEIG